MSTDPKTDPKADPKTDPKTDPKSDPKVEAPAEKPKAPEWKARVGAACSAVYMKGGPEFHEAPGKILKLYPDGTADVAFTLKGAQNVLEQVPFLERARHFERTGYTLPR